VVLPIAPNKVWSNDPLHVRGNRGMRDTLSTNTTVYSSHPQRGSTFAEAAIITPCFLVVLFVCIQFMVISFRSLSLQWITTEVTRDLALSRCEPRSQGCLLFTTSSGQQIWRTRNAGLRLQYARKRAAELATPFGIRLPNDPNDESKVCISELQSPTGGCSNPGSPGSLIQIDSTYDLPLFFSKFLFVEIAPVRLHGRAITAVENFPQIN
jgi:hypothetical protein